MNKLIRKIIFITTCIIATKANAEWINSSGQVESLSVYDRNKILVKLKDNNGSPIAACSNKEYFIIPATYSEESRNRMYSTLLAAKVAGQKVMLAYSDVGNCDAWGVTPNVYRKIIRLSF